MKKYNCLIVDDEPPAREVLRRYVAQATMLNLVGECANAIQAITAVKQQEVDLIFLDIQMPQLSGIDLIRTLSQQPKIILTTAFEQYAVQAFELNATDYLVKPISFERFLKAVIKILPDQKTPTEIQQVNHPARTLDQTFLYFRADRKMVKVFLSDILYVESLKDYVKVHTIKGMVVTKYAMVSLEAMLPANNFLRIHRSFLISIDKIDSFTADEIDVQGRLLPIGKLYRQQTLKMLTST